VASEEFDYNETMCVINLRDFHNYCLYIHKCGIETASKINGRPTEWSDKCMVLCDVALT